MAGRGGARAHVVYPIVELSSLEHPQWLDAAGREVDVDPSDIAEPSVPQDGLAEAAILIEDHDAVQQDEDVEMEGEATADAPALEDEEAVDGELLSVADSTVLHYSLLQTRQRHVAQLLPHIFSHPPIPSHARPRARALPKSQFMFPTPPPPTQPLPYPEYHGPKPPEKPKDKGGSKEASSSTPSTPKPGDDEATSSQLKEPAPSSRTEDDDKASPAKVEPNSTEATDTPAPKTGRQRKNKAVAAAAEEDAPAHETECIARVTLSVGPISYPETELWVGRFVEPRASGPRHSRPRGERGSEGRASGSAGRLKGTGGSSRRSLALDATLRRAKMTLESGPNGPPRPGFMPSPTQGMPGRPYGPPAPGMPPRPPGPGGYPQRPFPAPPVGFGPLPNAPPAGARQNIPPALIQRVNAAAARHPWLSVIIHKAARSSASKDELAKLGRIVARLNRGEDVGEGPEEGLPPSVGPSAAPGGASVRPPLTGADTGPRPAVPTPSAPISQESQDSAAPSAAATKGDVKPTVQPRDESTPTAAPESAKPASSQEPVADSDSELSDDEDFMHGPPQVGGGSGTEPAHAGEGRLLVPVPGSPDSSLSSAPPSPEVTPAPLPPVKSANGSAPASSSAPRVPAGPAAGSSPLRPAAGPPSAPAVGPGRPAGPNTPSFRPHAPSSTPRPTGRPPGGSPFTTPFPQTPSLGPRPPGAPYGRPPGRPPYNPANAPPHPILGPGRPYSYGGPLPQTPSASTSTYPRPGMNPAGPRSYPPGTPPLLPPRAATPALPPPPPIPMWPAVPRFLLVAFKEQQTEKYLIPLGMNTYMSRVGGDYVTGPPPAAPVMNQRPNGMGPMPPPIASVAGPSMGPSTASGTVVERPATAAAQEVHVNGGIGTSAVAPTADVARASTSTIADPAPPAVPDAVNVQPNDPISAASGRGRTRAALGRQAKDNAPASPTVSKSQAPVPVKQEVDKPLALKQEAPTDRPKQKFERPISTMPALPGEKSRPGTVLISLLIPVTGWSKPDWKEIEQGLPWSNDALMRPRPPKPTPAAEDAKQVEESGAIPAVLDSPAAASPKPATPALRKKRAAATAKETQVQRTEVSEQPTLKEKRLPHVYNLPAQDFTPKGETPMQAITVRLEGVDDALWRKIKAVSDESRFEEIRVMLEEETELVAELRAHEPSSVKGPTVNPVIPNSGPTVLPKAEATTEEADKLPRAGQSVPNAGPQVSATGGTQIPTASASAISTVASAPAVSTATVVPPSQPVSTDQAAPPLSVGPATAQPPAVAGPPTTATPETPRPSELSPNGSTTSAQQSPAGSAAGPPPLQTPVRHVPPVRPPFRPFPSPAEMRLLNKIYDERKRDRFSRLVKRVQPRSFLRFRVPQVDPVIKDAMSDKWAPRPYPITTKPLYNPAEEDSLLDQPEMPEFDFVEPGKGKKRKKDEQEEVFAYEMPVSLDALDELVEEGAARLTGGRRGRGRGGGLRGGRSARANDGPSVEIDENGNIRRRYGKRSKPGAVCEGCAGQGLRVWRKGPGGKGTLCNACGDKFLAGTLGELKAPGVNGPAEDAKDGQDGNSDGEKDAEEELDDGQEHGGSRADSVDVKKEAIAAETDPSLGDQDPTSNAPGSITVNAQQLNEASGEPSDITPSVDEQTGSHTVKTVLQPEEAGAASEAANAVQEERAGLAEAEQPVTEEMDVD